MKMTVTVKEQVEVKFLKVNAYVRYWEDANVNGVEDENGNLIPCRQGDGWCPIIEIETGKITNWVKGKVADIHYKVCDAGVYTLLDSNRNVIKEIEDYVPGMMCPKDEGYGDYIIMDVDENGFIQDWKPSFDEFED